jgi:hypothetical protein
VLRAAEWRLWRTLEDLLLVLQQDIYTKKLIAQNLPMEHVMDGEEVVNLIIKE